MIYYFNSKHAASPGDAVQILSPKNKSTQDFYRYVEFDKQHLTVFLNEKGLNLNFRNIAKGYAKDKVKYLLKQNGVSSGIIKSDNEIVTWGTGLSDRIETFETGNFCMGDYAFSGINMSDLAIVTLGINEAQPIVERYKNVQLQAKKTACGGDIHTVTLVCSSAAMARCLHPSLVEIGLTGSLEFINQMQEVAVIVTDNHNTGLTSKNVSLRKSSTLCAV